MFERGVVSDWVPYSEHLYFTTNFYDYYKYNYKKLLQFFERCVIYIKNNIDNCKTKTILLQKFEKLLKK